MNAMLSRTVLSTLAVGTMLHTSVRTGEITAYVTMPHVSLKEWRNWLAMRRYLARIIEKDIPKNAKIVIAFTNSKGEPTKQRTLRQGRANG